MAGAAGRTASFGTEKSRGGPVGVPKGAPGPPARSPSPRAGGTPVRPAGGGVGGGAAGDVLRGAGGASRVRADHRLETREKNLQTSHVTIQRKSEASVKNATYRGREMTRGTVWAP